MDKTIYVRILGREYPLRVEPHHEEATREIAAYVDARMRAVRSAFPDRPDLTTAVIASLSVAEELFRIRREGAGSEPAAITPADLDALTARLDDVLSE